MFQLDNYFKGMYLRVPHSGIVLQLSGVTEVETFESLKIVPFIITMIKINVGKFLKISLYFLALYF